MRPVTMRLQPRQIELPDEDNDAVGSFLEFLYTGEYFPRKVPGQRVLETHPSLPEVDDSGEHLLRHARIFTLAEKFGMELLKKLAASKIHCINSTARGEIAYARYVYANTERDDTSVGHRLPASGRPGRMRLGPRRRRSLRACAWSTQSLATRS